MLIVKRQKIECLGGSFHSAGAFLFAQAFLHADELFLRRKFAEKTSKTPIIQFTLIVIYGTINTTTMLALELWTELKGQECFVNQSLYKEML